MKEKRIKILLFIFFVVSFFVSCVPNNSLEKQIIGTWTNMNNNNYTQYEFKPNGECIIIEGGFFRPTFSLNGDWKALNNKTIEITLSPVQKSKVSVKNKVIHIHVDTIEKTYFRNKDDLTFKRIKS